MSQYVLRPSRLDDFEALMDLARSSGTGFTSLPVDERQMRERLEKSEKAFSGKLAEPQYGKYLMMLEEAATGEVAGCSAVKCGTGIQEPFFNYRIITVAQASQVADKRFDMDVLILTNEFVGCTEVATLFLKEGHRGSGGAGRLAAQSRYLLMATDPERFGDRILSELRGVTDEEGNTPFWECLSKHFFKMTFPEADYMSAVTDNQFILDLMPNYPIYIDLLPPDGREAIGRCHRDGVGAMKLLEWEGFRFERTVDIFDGGPMMAADLKNIRTFREARIVRVAQGSPEGTVTGIVATTGLQDFRSILLNGDFRGEDEIVLSANDLSLLGLKDGDEARIWKRSQ